MVNGFSAGSSLNAYKEHIAARPALRAHRDLKMDQQKEVQVLVSVCVAAVLCLLLVVLAMKRRVWLKAKAEERRQHAASVEELSREFSISDALPDKSSSKDAVAGAFPTTLQKSDPAGVPAKRRDSFHRPPSCGQGTEDIPIRVIARDEAIPEEKSVRLAKQAKVECKDSTSIQVF